MKVRAAVAILDRTGHRPGVHIEVDPGTEWSKLFSADSDVFEVGVDRTLPVGADV